VRTVDAVQVVDLMNSRILASHKGHLLEGLRVISAPHPGMAA
jgi:hypothetical protein